MLRRAPVLVALGCAAAGLTAVLWFLANDLAAGRRLDARAGHALHDAAPASADAVLRGLISLADPIPFAVAAIALIGLAWLRRGWPLALAAGGLLLVANATAQLLQWLLRGPRHADASIAAVDVGSWPSGHAAAALTLMLCAVLIAGPRLRSMTAVAAAGCAVCVGGALVGLGGHLPSDVLAGALVATAFAAFAAAAVAGMSRDAPVRGRGGQRVRELAPRLGVAAGGVVLAVAVAKALATRPDRFYDAVSGGAVLPIALLAVAVVSLGTGLLVLARRR